MKNEEGIHEARNPKGRKRLRKSGNLVPVQGVRVQTTEREGEFINYTEISLRKESRSLRLLWGKGKNQSIWGTGNRFRGEKRHRVLQSGTQRTA